MKQSQSFFFFFSVDKAFFLVLFYILEQHKPRSTLSFEVVPLESFLAPFVSVVRLCRKKNNIFLRTGSQPESDTFLCESRGVVEKDYNEMMYSIEKMLMRH